MDRKTINESGAKEVGDENRRKVVGGRGLQLLYTPSNPSTSIFLTVLFQPVKEKGQGTRPYTFVFSSSNWEIRWWNGKGSSFIMHGLFYEILRNHSLQTQRPTVGWLLCLF